MSADPIDEMVRVIEEALSANALRLATSRGGYVGGGQPHATLESDPGSAEAIARALIARKVAEPSRVLSVSTKPPVDGLREAVIEYLEADAAMPEFADAQRMKAEEWDALNHRWIAADVALRALVAQTAGGEG
jgi:hypothetical protein